MNTVEDHLEEYVQIDDRGVYAFDSGLPGFQLVITTDGSAVKTSYKCRYCDRVLPERHGIVRGLIASFRLLIHRNVTCDFGRYRGERR